MRSAMLAACLALAACGGVGGPTAGGPASGAIATRAVPGGAITMERTGPDTFRISTDVAAVRTIEVLQGADYDTAVPVTVSALAGGGWAGTAGGGARLLVRLTLGDGATVESAPGDFDIR